MSQSKTTVQWNEDGSATCLARLTARNGTGAAITGEGYWLKIADVTSITCHVWDMSAGEVEVTPAPTVTVATSIIDTPVTDGVIWTVDDTGYNFLFDIAGTYFPTGGKIYRVEFFATLATTGTATLPWSYEGEAKQRVGA